MPWTQELSVCSFLLHTSACSLPQCHLFLNFRYAFSGVCMSPTGNRSKSLDINPCLLLLLLLFYCTTCANTPSPPHSGPWRDAEAQLSFPIAFPQIRQLTGSAPAVELCLGRNQKNRRHCNCGTSVGSLCGRCRQRKTKLSLWADVNLTRPVDQNDFI